MLNSGSSRRRGWILQSRKLKFGVVRAPYAIWDPIFGHVAPRFLFISFFRPASDVPALHLDALRLGDNNGNE